jgi:hypothetical protein
VHDGFALEKSTVRSPLGGALLNRAMAASVQKKGVLIRPRLSFRRIERAPGVWEVWLRPHASCCLAQSTNVTHDGRYTVEAQHALHIAQYGDETLALLTAADA